MEISSSVCKNEGSDELLRVFYKPK